MQHDEYPLGSSDRPIHGDKGFEIKKFPSRHPDMTEIKDIEDEMVRRLDNPEEEEEGMVAESPSVDTEDTENEGYTGAEYAQWPSEEGTKVKPKLQGVEVEQKLDRNLFRTPKQTEGKSEAESLHKTKGDKPRNKTTYRYSGGKSANRPQATL
jgi:hypothetical protein